MLLGGGVTTMAHITKTRQQIAARQNAEVAEARKLLGPAAAYGRWVIHDTTGQEPDLVILCCRQAGGGGWRPNPESLYPGLLQTRREDGFEHRGQIIRYMRYQAWFGALVEYHPLSDEQLVERRKTRQRRKAAKQVERERAAMPLFADQIAGGE